MRLTQNEIIQAGRSAERFEKTAFRRVIMGALMWSPGPIRRWALKGAMKLTIKAMRRQGYTASDILAVFEDAVRRRDERM